MNETTRSLANNTVGAIRAYTVWFQKMQLACDEQLGPTIGKPRLATLTVLPPPKTLSVDRHMRKMTMRIAFTGECFACWRKTTSHGANRKVSNI